MANKNINLNAQRVNSKDIDNSALEEAIAVMKKEPTAQHQNDVINIALRSSFFVPAMMVKNTELVESPDHKVRFEDKQSARFMLIQNKDKQSYFPAYTNTEYLQTFKSDSRFQGFVMKFGDLANLTEQTASVSGFVINPNKDDLPFTKEFLDHIKKILTEAHNKRVAAQQAEAEGKPNIEVTTNTAPDADK
ncbi:MAG: SseB family protein [Ruminococcus sp.]|nr:SseB family protein [Ruminococcus sp.]